MCAQEVAINSGALLASESQAGCAQRPSSSFVSRCRTGWGCLRETPHDSPFIGEHAAGGLFRSLLDWGILRQSGSGGGVILSTALGDASGFFVNRLSSLQVPPLPLVVRLARGSHSYCLMWRLLRAHGRCL